MRFLMMKSKRAGRIVEALSLILILVLAISASIGFAEAQTAMRVFWDDFEDYEVKTYSGAQDLDHGSKTSAEVEAQLTR